MSFAARNLMTSFAVACIALPVVTSATAARAELPPGAYEKLLKDAQEVYRLRIDNVKPAAEDPGGTQHFTCEAKILGVERSKAGRNAGDTIQFSTYYVPPEVWRRGFAGPKSPPLLKAGWQGTVYLNPPPEGDVLELAAYGRSFVFGEGTSPSPSQSPQPNAPGTLGIATRPTLQGGLDILGVRPNSLADHLGLRPGDRLVKINGQEISSPAAVKAALDADAQRTAVTIVRKEKTVEIATER